MVLRRYAVRLALLLLPWLVILAVPQFRHQMWVTVFSFHYGIRSTPWVGLLGDRSVQRGSEAPATPAQEAMNIVAGAGPQWMLSSGDRSLYRLQEFGRLSNRYPQEAWIVALALRHFDYFQDGRVEYTLVQPSISTAMSQVNEVKPAALKEAYRLVRRGQSLEPDNAFFDWMEVRLLIIARRDREALDLLQRLVHKPRYNEHFRELITAQIADIEARRPVLPDERTGTTYFILLPELSLYGHTRGTVLWRMDQLEHNQRVVTFGAVRDFLRCCGTYATVFSWLLLLTLMANLPIQAELNANLKQFLAQTTQWTRVALTEPAPAPKAIRALPAIPVFPTPTPVPAFVPSVPGP